MDIGGKGTHVKLKNSNNENLYKKMYLIPESELGSKDTFSSPKTSFRKPSKKTKFTSLEMKKKVQKQSKIKKDACHVCKKIKRKAPNETSLTKQTCPKIEKINKKNQLEAEKSIKYVSKNNNLNKKSNVNDKNNNRETKLEPIFSKKISKFINNLPVENLKFKSDEDYKKMLNEIYKFAVKKNTSRTDKVSSFNEMKSLLEEFKHQIINNKEESLTSEQLDYEEQLEYLESLIQAMPDKYKEKTPKNSQSFNLLENPNDVSVNEIYQEFVQSIVANSPILQRALKKKSNPVSRCLNFSTPKTPRVLHSKIIDPKLTRTIKKATAIKNKLEQIKLENPTDANNEIKKEKTKNPRNSRNPSSASPAYTRSGVKRLQKHKLKTKVHL